MEFDLLNRKFKVSLFSLIIFIFFLLVSLVSLFIVREKILHNSHIMGREIAARFATRETAKIKSQEMLLRSVVRSMGHLLTVKPSWTDEEIERSLRRFTEYMEKNTELLHFDMCAVIDGRLIGSKLDKAGMQTKQLKWYTAALNNGGNVAYTNLYRYGHSNEYVLTMATRLNHNDDVLAINIYPEKLNALLEDNKLPQHSYYYLCDPNGNIMVTLNDREMSIESQQPYVDQILSEIRKGGGIDSVSYITDLEGNKRGVYYTVSDNGWISIVTIPYDFLLGDYENLLHWFILTLAIFLLLGLLLGMREHVLNKQIENFNEVIQVMSKAYFAIFRVNYRNGKYTILKAERINSHLAPEGSYEELLQQMIASVEPDAAAEFAETFSLENIQKLVEKHIYDFGGEFRQRFGDEYKWVSVRLLRDEKFLRSDEAIFFFRDVDAEKLKELEHIKLTEHSLRAARENAKSRDMFFTAMSHDMRAPLNGIIGMAELASLHLDNKNLVGDYVQKIRSSGRQLLTLINDILEMAHLDNCKVEHLQETFDMSAAMQDIAGIFKVQAEMEEKYFEEQILLPQEMVTGDLQSLHQILNNILSNALKYTKAKDSIQFMVRRESAGEKNRVSYTFIVKDSGCGMSEKFLEKIYEPFERDSRFGVPKVVGTGLGMTIVKGLVDRLDGSIHISSRVNEGTCVIISLPFTLAKQAQVSAAEADLPQLSAFAGCRILVAEDNDINMEIITELLSMNGLEVVPATDGREAVDKFAVSGEGSISMVLMDVQMPRLDGCEAARAIRGLQRSDALSVPIIALTGNGGAADVEAAMQAGMNGYMLKPVKMKLLAKMLSEYLHH